MVWRRRKTDLDLGDGRWARYYSDGQGPRAGLFIIHPKGPARTKWDAVALVGRGRCVGSVQFAGRGVPNHHHWTVKAADPLTLDPSIRCKCGDHGFIHGGRWIPA